MEKEFKLAIKKFNKIKNIKFEDFCKLKALYKFIKHGKCNVPKPKIKYIETNFCKMLCGIPSIFDFTDRDIWKEWNDIGNISKEEAIKMYIEMVNKY